MARLAPLYILNFDAIVDDPQMMSFQIAPQITVLGVRN